MITLVKNHRGIVAAFTNDEDAKEFVAILQDDFGGDTLPYLWERVDSDPDLEQYRAGYRWYNVCFAPGQVKAYKVPKSLDPGKGSYNGDKDWFKEFYVFAGDEVNAIIEARKKLEAWLKEKQC